MIRVILNRLNAARDEVLVEGLSGYRSERKACLGEHYGQPSPTPWHSESKYPANTRKTGIVRLVEIRVAMGGEEAVIRSPAQLGQLVQTLRRQRNLSQRELAQNAGGISQARMSALELHPERLTLDRLLLITAALDLELVVRPRSAPAPVAEW